MSQIDKSRKLLTYQVNIYPNAPYLVGFKKKTPVTEDELIKLFRDAAEKQFKQSIDVYKQYVKKQKWEIDSISYVINPGGSCYTTMTINYWESEEQWSKRIKASEAAKKAAKTRELKKQTKDFEMLQKLMDKHNIQNREDVSNKLSRQRELISEVHEDEVS